jgi:hypothetical protein
MIILRRIATTLLALVITVLIGQAWASATAHAAPAVCPGGRFEDGSCAGTDHPPLSRDQVSSIIEGMCVRQGGSGPACEVAAQRSHDGPSASRAKREALGEQDTPPLVISGWNVDVAPLPDSYQDPSDQGVFAQRPVIDWP